MLALSTPEWIKAKPLSGLPIRSLGEGGSGPLVLTYEPLCCTICTMNLFDPSPLTEQGEKLRSNIHKFAGDLSDASRDSVKKTNSALEGTELGEEWPLTSSPIIEQRVAEMAMPRSIGYIAIGREQPQPTVPEIFMGDKIRNSVLAEAYGDDQPREAFARDVLNWINKMHETGWSLLAQLFVDDMSRVELRIYTDNEAGRNYFDTLTSTANLTPEDVDEGAEPYAWLGERIIVDDPTFTSKVAAEVQ